MTLLIQEAPPPRETPSRPGVAGGPRIAVAIPARDEAHHIGACLAALADQQDPPEFELILALNNCRDRTRDVVSAMAPNLPFDVVLFDFALDDAEADAATARRLAMNAAAARVGAGGHILSSDADSRVAPPWIANTMREFEAGVDIVCGFVTPDTSDQPNFDMAAFMRGAQEFVYSQATAELIALVDPKPYDPWPHHLMETGASLAIRADAYCALGGLPRVSPGEDRALAELARRRGLKIRHTLEAHVVTSSRIDGRAAGGWSADLLARLTDPNGRCHELLEHVRPTFLRAALRHAYQHHRDERSLACWARRFDVSEAALAALRDLPPAEAWAQIEAASPPLQRRRMRAAELPAELTRLQALVERTRRRRAGR